MCAVSGILDPTFSVTTVGMLIELSIHGLSEHVGVLERPFLGIETAQRFSMSDSQGRRNPQHYRSCQIRLYYRCGRNGRS